MNKANMYGYPYIKRKWKKKERQREKAVKKTILKKKKKLETFKKNKGGILIEGIYVNGVKGYYGFGI